MKSVQVLILLAFFASAFAAVAYKKGVEPKSSYDPENIYPRPIEQFIRDLLDQLKDPMPINDTSVELILDGLLLTAETTGVVITGASGIELTDVIMGLLGNFVIKFDVPILVATGSILHKIKSDFVWPKPIYGDGPLEGHLTNIKLEVTGILILLPLGVRNFDYKLSLGGVFFNQDGLMGGPGGLHDKVEAHLNSEGHIAIMAIEALNHEIFRDLLEKAIDQLFMKKFNH